MFPGLFISIGFNLAAPKYIPRSAETFLKSDLSYSRQLPTYDCVWIATMSVLNIRETDHLIPKISS